MTVRTIYNQVCEVLLEGPGLTLGTYTEADFLRAYSEVVQDFLQQTMLVKKLINILAVNGTSVYLRPNLVMETEEALFDDRYLHETEVIDFDYYKRTWKGEAGRPRRWHVDRLQPNQFGVQPTPSLDGYSVAASASFYGTLSSVSGAIDFNVAASAPFYGVVSSFSGPIYLEASSWAFGTISGLLSTSLNVTLLGTVKPPAIQFVLDDVIQVVPDSFTQYLKWGVLARVFSVDSEMRDTQRAAYCSARYKEGIALATMISQEALEDEPAMLAG